MPEEGGDYEDVLGCFAEAGIDVDALSTELQHEDAASAVKSWIELLSGIASKSAALVQADWYSAAGRTAHWKGTAGRRKDGKFN